MKNLSDLLERMEALRSSVHETQKALVEEWGGIHSDPGVENLAAYIGLRRHDLRGLQEELALAGLSSLGRCEAHVLFTLDAVISALCRMLGKEGARQSQFPHGLRARTDRLLGVAPKHRWTRFMVTLPSQAAHDPSLVRDFLSAGMNCARINCAHDAPEDWLRMISNVRQAESETRIRCRIMMDLAGPKLRTGRIAPGPPVLHLNPRRDMEGRVEREAPVILDSSGSPGKSTRKAAIASLSVAHKWLKCLSAGDEVHFRDMLKRNRKLRIAERFSEFEVLAFISEGAYVAPGTRLECRQKNIETTTLDFSSDPHEIRLYKGDALFLSKQDEAGKPAELDMSKSVKKPATISCQQPEVFDFLKAGEKVWIDDGRLGALIEKVNEAGAWLRITHARRQGEKIGEGKGLNFPDSDIRLPPLSAKDRENLAFAVRHADMVGYSFVNRASDVDELVAAMDELGGAHVGIVAKIETKQAVRNLPEILVHGMKHDLGAMIARGDLALEIGYERLAEIQEEILWICEAAHVPVIWATQVLENLVQTGMPSRAEITDAAMAERAECIMLNKGEYIPQALRVLDSVVTRMQDHQHKKVSKFRALHW